MKKILPILLLAVITHINAWAQQGYTFSQTSGTYTDLPGATLLSGTPIWDDTTFNASLGFNFTINNETFNSIEVNSNGVILTTSFTALRAVFGLEADLADRGTTTSASPINFLVTGTAGSRIAKIEYKNAGFYDDSPSSTTLAIPGAFANVQIWLYETSNKVEVHYGPSTVPSLSAAFGTAGGPGVGLVTDYDFLTDDLSGIFLSGPVPSPQAVGVTLSQNYPSLTGMPTNGTIYVFTQGGSIGLPETLNQTRIEMYPNPASDMLTIKGLQAEKGNVQIRIYDVLGKLALTTEAAAAATIPVNLRSLQKGAYFIEIISGGGRAGKQILKQ